MNKRRPIDLKLFSSSSPANEMQNFDSAKLFFVALLRSERRLIHLEKELLLILTPFSSIFTALSRLR